jgi:solute carrier family 25 carnitine/acylcarnitine transporter 20/29
MEYLAFVPGFVQGIVRVGISYPFDSLKVYMQKGIYKSTLSCLLNIIRKDIKTLYRGSSLSFIFISIDRSIQYYFTEKLNKSYNSYVSGLIMGSFSSIYQVPLQYITTNAILTERHKYVNISTFVKQLDRNKLYRGYSVEYVRCLIATTIYLGTYMGLRNNLNEKQKVYLSPFLGSLAGIASWMVTFPLDTIRTEKQTTDKSVRDIIKTKTFRSYYLGITPVIFRSIPSASAGMFAYEYTKKTLNIE